MPLQLWCCYKSFVDSNSLTEHWFEFCVAEITFLTSRSIKASNWQQANWHTLIENRNRTTSVTKIIPKNSNLMKHQQTNIGENRSGITFAIIGFWFTQNIDPIDHTSWTHTSWKLINCNVSYVYGISFAKHRMTHSEQKQHRFHVCDEMFTQKDRLTTKQQMHTIENPYRSYVCDNWFDIKSDVIVHMWVPHG